MLAQEVGLLAQSSGYTDRVNTKCQSEWDREKRPPCAFQSFLATIVGKYWEKHPWWQRALHPASRKCPGWLGTGPAVLYISTFSIFKTLTRTNSFECHLISQLFLGKMLSNSEASRRHRELQKSRRGKSF